MDKMNDKRKVLLAFLGEELIIRKLKKFLGRKTDDYN